MSSNPSIGSAVPVSRILRAVIRKELKDGFRWSVAGFLLSSGVWAFALNELSFSLLHYFTGTQILPSLFTFTPVVAALFGLGLGLVQAIPENRGDAWGFLAHRPASLNCLFWGKVFAGLLLYLAAVDIPLLGAVAWVAMPGHLPQPFDWPLLWPVVVDNLTGLGFYFAGLIVGFRQARWYGSRVLCVGLAIICSVLAVNVPSFGLALLGAVIGVAILALAAWGHFKAGGAYGDQPLAARWATAMTLGVSLEALAVFVLCFMMVFLPPVEPGQQQGPDYTVADDGSIVQTISRGTTRVVSDLEGHPIREYKPGDGTSFVDSNRAFIDPVRVSENNIRGYREASVVFVQLFNNAMTTYYWYYLQREHLIAAYNVKSARVEGWMGPDGFVRGATPPARRFEGTFIGPGSYSTDSPTFSDAIYSVDNDSMRIEKIFSAPPGESVVSMSGYRVSRSLNRETSSRAFDTIVTDRKIYVQSLDGRLLVATPLDPAAAGYGTVTVYHAPGSSGNLTHFWYSAEMGSRPVAEWDTLPIQVTVVSGNEVVAHHTLPRFGETIPGRPVPPLLFATITPPALFAAQKAFGWGTRELGPAGLAAATNASTRRAAMAIVLIMSVLSAMLLFRRARAYAFSWGRTWLWTILGLLFGIGGFVLLLLLEEWPALETCHACGRKRIATREQCEHCGAPFPSPARDGTEIFEDAA